MTRSDIGSTGGVVRWRGGKRDPEDPYSDDDPRLQLSSRQWLGMRAAARGDSIDAIATRISVSRNRVRRWLKTPRFRKAVALERARPTGRGLSMQIALMGVREANSRRALEAERSKQEEEASDE